MSEDRDGSGGLFIPSWYCISLKGFWSVIGDSSDTENTDQRRCPAPRSCSSFLWPAELLNARLVEGGRIAEVAVVQLGDINFHRVWQLYKALSLLFVTALLSQSLIIRVSWSLDVPSFFNKTVKCHSDRIAENNTQRSVILTRVLLLFFSPLLFTAKSLGQGAVRPGVLPHEPHWGGLLWLGVSEPSKDDGEWGERWKWKRSFFLQSWLLSNVLLFFSSFFPQVWLDHIKPIIKQLRRKLIFQMFFFQGIFFFECVTVFFLENVTTVWFSLQGENRFGIFFQGK